MDEDFPKRLMLHISTPPCQDEFDAKPVVINLLSLGRRSVYLPPASWWENPGKISV